MVRWYLREGWYSQVSYVRYGVLTLVASAGITLIEAHAAVISRVYGDEGGSRPHKTFGRRCGSTNKHEFPTRFIRYFVEGTA